MRTFVVTQHYRPDGTSTAEYMTAIAEGVASVTEVTVLSGTPASASPTGSTPNPLVVEVRNPPPPKGQILRRLANMLFFGGRIALALYRRVRRGDAVIVVTTPWTLPYVVVLVARLAGARAILLVYDLYPDVLIASGMTSENSLISRAIKTFNRRLFRGTERIIAIGRDMEKRLASNGASPEKLVVIPNWATLPVGYRPASPSNRFRPDVPAQLIVGLSGNLGFTHDPDTVFRAAAQLAHDPRIHFLLSGWGVGWDRLKARQAEEKLPNVTLVERVPEQDLEEFLAAADAWIIPYRKGLSGLSVPSRSYNLLAIGRPIVALSESDAEHAMIIEADDVGWVVPPENPAALADQLRAIAPADAVEKGRRAAGLMQGRYTRDSAAHSYRELVKEMMKSTPTEA